MNNTTRREFLTTALAGLAMGRSAIAAQEQGPGGLPRRPLGKTGEKVTIIGLGGWHIGAVEERGEAVAIMHQAIDEGLTFFDNCWEYHDGGSEALMGKALATGGRRDKVFLMTKVCGRTYRSALQHLEDSLRRLRTDRIDLWQFHGIKWKDDPELIFDPQQGALKAAVEARKAGKIRYIGFTGHENPDRHLAMLEGPFAWDTVQMPINVLDAHYRSFQRRVLPKCRSRKIGVIAMKGLALGGRVPGEIGLSAEVCRRYSLSLPISSLVCGITSRKDLEQDLAVARNFKPMTEAELLELVARTKDKGSDGHLEAYKIGDFGCNWHHRKP